MTVFIKKIKQSQGFTLIEVMVAIVLLSVILLLLFSSLFTANKYWVIAGSQVEQNDEVRLVSRFIRQQLSQSIPLQWVDVHERKLLFIGEQEALYFVSSLPAYRGGGGVHALKLMLKELDGNQQFGMSYRLLTPDDKPFQEDAIEDEQFVTIASDIKSIHFSYYGKEKNDDEPRWFDRWSSDIFLPQLVRLKINSMNKNIKWPDINIPIRAYRVHGQAEFIVKAANS